MAPIKKSVKVMIIELLKEKGEMDLHTIYDFISKEREGVHAAHIRGVLNRDIKTGGKFFKRTGRGTYSLIQVAD